MDLEVTRLFKTDKSTIGVLVAQSASFIRLTAYSLEPPIRTDDVKPRAIPVGVYKVTLYQSPKRGYKVALLHDVAGFEAIEIHIGNFPKDTEGCILLGNHRGPDEVLDSEVIFQKLMALLEEAESNGEVNTISIIDGTSR